SKLEPGQKVTWTAVVTGQKAKKHVAEMVATLYDESLDALLPHHWQQRLSVFRRDGSNLATQFENVVAGLQHIQGHWPQQYKQTDWSYRTFPHDIAGNFWGYGFFDGPDNMAGFMPGQPGRGQGREMAFAARQNALADGAPADRRAEGGEKEQQRKATGT